MHPTKIYNTLFQTPSQSFKQNMKDLAMTKIINQVLSINKINFKYHTEIYEYFSYGRQMK